MILYYIRYRIGASYQTETTPQKREGDITRERQHLIPREDETPSNTKIWQQHQIQRRDGSSIKYQKEMAASSTKRR